MIETHDVELVLGPSWRDAENCMSTTGGIKKDALLGDVQWLIKRQDEHAGAERHALCIGG